MAWQSKPSDMRTKPDTSCGQASAAVPADAEQTGALRSTSRSDYNAFAHLTAEKSEIYRAVLNAFASTNTFRDLSRGSECVCGSEGPVCHSSSARRRGKAAGGKIREARGRHGHRRDIATAGGVGEFGGAPRHCRS